MGAGKRKEYKAVGKQVKRRICLRCGKKFRSSHKFNRICLDCKTHPIFRYHRGG